MFSRLKALFRRNKGSTVAVAPPPSASAPPGSEMSAATQTPARAVPHTPPPPPPPPAPAPQGQGPPHPVPPQGPTSPEPGGTPPSQAPTVQLIFADGTVESVVPEGQEADELRYLVDNLLPGRDDGAAS